MIEVQHLNGEIGFRVAAGEELDKIYQWEREVDTQVFEEQLATGYYRGRFPVDRSILELMKQAKKAGKILPYYGAGGSSGACIYCFQILDAGRCKLKVWHSLAQEALELIRPLSRPEEQAEWARETEIQYSFLPYVTDEELSHPWTGKRNAQLICKIADREYQNLVAWPNWVGEEALTSRYIYKFGQVSIGPTGFSVKVEDLKTGTTIDVTDYDSW
ncbi:MAG: hypothetical protein KME26_16520 [Oscillatoria princeps RMCB-10]|nr:hypothetical protein [Oscillatoria princeps RMCB-10]